MFLFDIVLVSEKLNVEECDINGELCSVISFLLEVDGEDMGICFFGIFGGYEFNLFVFVMLYVVGIEFKLDDSVKLMVKVVNELFNFEVFISLSCYNCFEVV